MNKELYKELDRLIVDFLNHSASATSLSRLVRFKVLEIEQAARTDASESAYNHGYSDGYVAAEEAIESW